MSAEERALSLTQQVKILERQLAEANAKLEEYDALFDLQYWAQLAEANAARRIEALKVQPEITAMLCTICNEAGHSTSWHKVQPEVAQ